MRKELPGINIQWPWSELIANELKTVETRSYPIPSKFIGKELAIIETPGPRGKTEAGIEKARIIGLVIFSESFKYESHFHWDSDRSRHLVSADDQQFSFSEDKQKWGWVVAKASIFKKPLPAPVKKGIVFATNCKV